MAMPGTAAAMKILNSPIEAVRQELPHRNTMGLGGIGTKTISNISDLAECSHSQRPSEPTSCFGPPPVRTWSMPERANLEQAKEHAFKYVWNKDTEECEAKKVRIIMEEKPFKQGAMRVVHKAWEFSDNKMVAGVVKYFKEREISLRNCFNMAMTQLLVDEFAVRFNEALQCPRNVCFVPVSVLQLRERSNQIVSFEPFLGKYIKHTDNDGPSDIDELLPQAFSHFTWEASDRKLLVCEIQGVGDFYTDPQVYSTDGEGFGTGNMGLGGINKFFVAHRCNAICRQLKLDDSVRFASWEEEQTSQEDSYCRLRRHSHNPRTAPTPGELASALKCTLQASAPSSPTSAKIKNMRGLSLSMPSSPRSAAVKAKVNRSRKALEGESGSTESSSGRQTFSASSKKIASIWSSSKKFGSALVSAIKNIPSPTSSPRNRPCVYRQEHLIPDLQSPH